MTQTALSGPFIAFGKELPGPDNNEAQGPSVFDQAWMLMDPQAPFAYAGGNSWRGWLSAGEYVTADYIPGATSATSIAAVQTVTGALTLASTSAGGVNISGQVVNLSTGVLVTGLLVIDSLAGSALAYGSGGFGSIWNPAGVGSRNISITNGATMSAGTVFTVAGFDYRGAPMTEAITASGSGSATVGAKAFKYVASITPSTAVNGASAGIGTLAGLPIRSDFFAYLNVSNNNTAGTSGNFTAAVTSSASATTGDVRGTYSIAITATSRFVVFQRVGAGNINTLAGLVGVPQA